MSISRRNERFRIDGDARRGGAALALLQPLYEGAAQPIEAEALQLALRQPALPAAAARAKAASCCTRAAPTWRARTPNQLQYLRHMLAHDISFGIGPAGTGKTFLAVACAVDALERSTVQRIVLTRPAVEAGERLGFLPGDMAQKVDPYLRPLYDALYDLMGLERVTRPSTRACSRSRRWPSCAGAR